MWPLLSFKAIKKYIISNIDESDVVDSIKKVDELTDNGYELVLVVQRESGKIETIKIIGFEVVKND